MAALGAIWDLGFPYTLIPIKDQSMPPVVEAQSLKPWTTREAPSPLLKLMVVQQLVVLWVFSWEVSSRFCCSAILLQTTWESSAKNDPDIEHLQPNLSSAGGGEYVLLVWWGMEEVLNQTISAASFNATYLCISLCSSCIFFLFINLDFSKWKLSDQEPYLALSCVLSDTQLSAGRVGFQ